MQKPDFSEKIILITGATRGLGRALALELADTGAHLILTGRTEGALEEVDDEIKAKGGHSTLVPLNFQKDLKSVDELGAAIYQRWGRLDGLVGNAAALGSITPLPHIVPKEFEKVMQINLAANYRLIRSLDPLLRQSEAGRVVFMTSSVAQTARAYWATYAISKAGLEAMARIYAQETENNTSLKVNLFNPGRMRTEMRRKAYPSEDQESLPLPAEIAPHVLPLLAASCETTGQLYDAPSQSWKNF